MADVEITKVDEEVSPLEKDHSLSVVLPSGLEKNTTVHGSKPVMDLLVTLCASYHLNPSDYTVEFLSTNKNDISFKPNSLVGSLEAEKMVLKPKGTEEKPQRPYVPEATVRLLINYNKSHKAVVRVNPRVPLETLLPLVCDKCEFQMESTVLLSDPASREPLDLRKTLNELGLREVFARDTAAKDCAGHERTTAAVLPKQVTSSSSLQDVSRKEKKKSENKGFLSLFRKHRKKSESDQGVSAPASPGLPKPRSVSVGTQDIAARTPASDIPKKRRAPQPPMGASQSTPNNLSTCHLQKVQRSGENTLRSTKRRAPAPPSVANNNLKNTATDCLNPLDEVSETVESVNSSPSPSSPCPPSLLHLHKNSRPTLWGKKDHSDARSALAKVLTSSLSKGMLVKRLKNSTSKLHSGTSSSENGIEIKSVLNTNLPTENEWEDPSEKKGLTTFKVVPSRKSSVAEPSLDVPQQDQAAVEVYNAFEEASTKSDQSGAEEETLDQSESRESDQSAQEAETTSCSLPLDNRSSVTEGEEIVETPRRDEGPHTKDLKEEAESELDHENVANEDDLYLGDTEEVVEVSSEECETELKTCDSKTSCDIMDKGVFQEDYTFPPPPPPVYFIEDVEEATTSSSVCVSERSVINGHVWSNSEPTQNTHSAENVEDKTVSAPSRFAQAVALAVQRSHLNGAGRTGGPQINQDSEYSSTVAQTRK